MNAKEDKFLYIGGPLMAGLAVIVLSSFAGMFLPSHYVRTLSLIEGLWLYGGLALFCGFVLYDTQKLMAKAQFHASHGTLER
jgi:FtsH-binding integral membrane protein